jgi:hypothetical protein
MVFRGDVQPILALALYVSQQKRNIKVSLITHEEVVQTFLAESVSMEPLQVVSLKTPSLRRAVRPSDVIGFQLSSSEDTTSCEMKEATDFLQSGTYLVLSV